MVQDHGYISHSWNLEVTHCHHATSQPYGILFFYYVCSSTSVSSCQKGSTWVPSRYIPRYASSRIRLIGLPVIWGDRINHSESSASRESKLPPLMETLEPIRRSFFWTESYDVPDQGGDPTSFLVPGQSINIFPAIWIVQRVADPKWRRGNLPNKTNGSQVSLGRELGSAIGPCDNM